jgi:hypothetical protein
VRLRLVVASLSEQVVEHCAGLLTELDDVQYRVGAGVEVEGDCDVELMDFRLAMDRYGGRPEYGQANVLRNTRDVGHPLVIVTTPPFAPDPAPVTPGDLARRLHTMFAVPVEAVLATPLLAELPTITMLVHVEGLGLDRIGLDQAMTALRGVLTAKR